MQPLIMLCHVVSCHGVAWHSICLLNVCTTATLLHVQPCKWEKKERKKCDSSPNGVPPLLLVLAPPHGIEGVVPDVWDLQQHLISKKK